MPRLVAAWTVPATIQDVPIQISRCLQLYWELGPDGRLACSFILTVGAFVWPRSPASRRWSLDARPAGWRPAPGLTTDERQRLKQLEQVFELRRARSEESVGRNVPLGGRPDDHAAR